MTLQIARGRFVPSPKTLGEALVAFGLAALTAWICISLSFEKGRLSLPSGYDDVVYLISGQQWLNDLGTHGFFASLLGLIEQHAPPSTFVAIFSFLVWGPHNWSVYASNGVLLAVTLFFLLRYFLRGQLPLALSALLLVCLVDIPFMQHAVTEFRPDLFAGIVTAFAILVLLEKPAYLEPRRTQIGLGLLFGFAFLCKPSEFLVTGFEITAAVLFSYAGFLRESPIASRQAASLILKSFGFFLLGAAIVFGPYLLDQGAEIFAYMYTALFTLGDVNAFHADRSAQFAYYLWNPAAGFVALGFWLWIGLAAMLTRLALTFGKARKALPTTLAAYTTLGAIYLTLSLASVKSYFLGSTFYATFSFLLLRDAAWLARTAMRPNATLAATVVAIFVLGLQRLFFPQLALATYNLGTDYTAAVLDSTEAMWKLTADAASHRYVNAGPVFLIANNPDPVKIAAIVLEGTRQRINIQALDGYYRRTVAEFLDIAATADITAVTVSMGSVYPSAQIGDEIQMAMDQDARFRFAKTAANGFVRIYETVNRVPAPSPN